MRFQYVLVILTLLACASQAVAPDIEVITEVPDEVSVGDTIPVVILVHNNEDYDLHLVLKEEVVGEGIGTPEPVKTTSGGWGWLPPYYEWEIDVPAKSSKTIEYKVRAEYPGYLALGGTRVEFESGETYRSDIVDVHVLCNQDGVCEGHESFDNCPEDCPSGSDDGICDYMMDGRCDPDCLEGGDPDCEAEVDVPQEPLPVEPPVEPKPKTNALLYWGIAAVLLIAAAAIHLKNRQRAD